MSRLNSNILRHILSTQPWLKSTKGLRKMVEIFNRKSCSINYTCQPQITCWKYRIKNRLKSWFRTELKSPNSRHCSSRTWDPLHKRSSRSRASNRRAKSTTMVSRHRLRRSKLKIVLKSSLNRSCFPQVSYNHSACSSRWEETRFHQMWFNKLQLPHRTTSCCQRR